ncbi:MAG: MOSC domain-containing protein [Myxococcales bacterium]|nr:MOSC domain-containing protein [Myxococcales bacterium]
MAVIGTVRELWRFPVKSMGGERLDRVDVDACGVRGDRLWAVRDDERAVITSAKKLPVLLQCSARYLAPPGSERHPAAIPAVAIELPDGATITSDDPAVDARLSALVGRKVSLCRLQPADAADHYRAAKPSAAEMRADFALADDEPLPDFSMMKLSTLMELGRFATPRGTYFDAAALHVVTTASLDALRDAAPACDPDARRFRANLVIASRGPAGFDEASWTGATLRAGTVTAAIDSPTPRCSMPTRPQPGLGADPAVLKAIAAHAARCLGAYGSVVAAGQLQVGDAVDLARPSRSALGGWLQARGAGAKRLMLRAAMPKK